MGRRRTHSINPTLRVFQPIIAKRSLEVGPRVRTALAQLEALRRQYLVDIEDHRRFHPAGVYRAPLSSRGRKVRIAALSLSSSHQSFVNDLYSGVRPYSTSPLRAASARAGNTKSVSICIRRQVRKEVIFARGHGGGKVKRSRKRTFNSNVFC